MYLIFFYSLLRFQAFPIHILVNLLNYIEWTKTIETASIRWIGQVFRMPTNTPARIALEEAERTVRMPRGRHKITWLKCAEENLAKLSITWENAKILAQDRTYWKSLTKN